MEGILYLLQQLKGMVTPIGIFDIIDILIMAFIIYKLIMLIRRTSSGAVAKGILVLIVALWASSLLQLNVCTDFFGNGCGVFSQFSCNGRKTFLFSETNFNSDSVTKGQVCILSHSFLRFSAATIRRR